MCAACVAQGVAYVGGAVAGLQVMAARARQRRARPDGGAPDERPVAAPAPTADGRADDASPSDRVAKVDVP
jgi:hypothetical protein